MVTSFLIRKNLQRDHSAQKKNDKNERRKITRRECVHKENGEQNSFKEKEPFRKERDRENKKT